MIPSDVVATRIKEMRLRHGWSAQQLAQKCTELGAEKVSGAVVANIETGRRKDGRRTRMMTVDELLIFALALDVPPLLLLMPESGPLEVTPEQAIPDPMRAATWATGYTAAQGTPDIFFSAQAAEILSYYTAQAALSAARAADRAAAGEHGTAREEQSAERRAAALERLAARMEPILRSGTVPRDLPASWVHEMVDRGWLPADAVPVDELARLERLPDEGNEDG